MRKLIRGKALLVGACILASASAWSQQDNNKAKTAHTSVDLGVTYAAERAYIAPGNCDCFWFNGGGADLTVTFWKGLGIAAALTGDHASNVAPGVDISKISYMFGPRYTYKPWILKVRRGSKLHIQVFGEGLFGDAHAFNSSFPTGIGLKSSADSYAMQIGGGLHVFVSKNFAVRVLQADYVRTALPNGTSDVQDDLRLGFGVTYHLGSLTHLR
jgi:hypothetical protein